MDAIVLISVVRDFAMYDRCVKGNPFVAGGELRPVDNREKNEGIPVGYNRFLDSRPPDERAWYVFCHEDFEWREPAAAVFAPSRFPAMVCTAFTTRKSANSGKISGFSKSFSRFSY